MKRKEISISTASLPDIVLCFLCFFMMFSHIREKDLKVLSRIPKASEATKLSKKALVQHFYLGKPLGNYEKTHGSKPRLQINDAFAEMDEIDLLSNQIRASMDPRSFESLTCALKVDKEVKMGLVTALKTQLRKNNLRKVSYLAIEN